MLSNRFKLLLIGGNWPLLFRSLNTVLINLKLTTALLPGDRLLKGMRASDPPTILQGASAGCWVVCSGEGDGRKICCQICICIRQGMDLLMNSGKRNLSEGEERGRGAPPK